MKLIRNIATRCLLLLLSFMCGQLMAQNLNPSNLSSSPYNRYGYGRLGSLGNSVTRTMGDVGIAIRSNQYTTLANPASLTAIDTLTMIFTVDLDAQMATFSESGQSETRWDAGFSGMSFQAPLWRNVAMSLSLTPYSTVGYYYGSSDRTPVQNPTQQHDTLTTASTHSGVGGINNFMLGLGWRPLRTKWHEISIGANAGWLFGTIQHSSLLATSAQANSTYMSYEATTRGLFLQFGAQYTCRLNATKSFTVGAIYSPALNMNVSTEALKYSTDTLSVTGKYRSGIKVPTRIGAGLTYNVARKLTVSAEYELDKWGSINGLSTEMHPQSSLFSDAQRIAVGAEYLPKVATNNFFKACRYRVGFSYQDSYLKVNDHTLKQLGATLGISMPINKRSALNLGVAYTSLRPEGSSMVSEDYITFNLGLTFNEMMFFRNMLR